MKKISALIFLLVFLSLKIAAQNAPVPDLQQINASAKNQFAKVEMLDELQQSLKYFDEHPVNGKDQQLLLLDTYRAIANGYSVNNHFKQGYQVYQKLLTLKENFLSAEKTDAISKTNLSLQEKQKKDEDELMSMQSQIHQLQLDNDNLQLKRKTFKQYFSIGIITLTVLFAFLLLQAGLKLNKIRQDLKAGRERLMAVHRISTLGRLKNGVLISVNAIFAAWKKFQEENASHVDKVAQMSGEKNTELSSLRKQINQMKSLA